MPRIATVTWARNESDILEVFVRHHAQIVDHMVILLHATRDNSAAILDCLQWEELSIEYRLVNRPDHAQEECLSTEVNRLLSEGYDLVLPLDADEFLCSKEGKNPRDALNALGQSTVYALPWKTYVPTPADDPAEPNPLLRITHRRSKEPEQYAKVLIPRLWASDQEITLAPGNHETLKGGAPAEKQPAETLYLAHFPVRSETQLRRKIGLGLAAVKEKAVRQENEAFHWRKLLKRCSAPEPFTAEELSNMARYYACQEETTAIELEHTPLCMLPKTTKDYFAKPAKLPPRVTPLVTTTLPKPHFSAHKEYTSALLFSHPRSGSTNLCAILSQHPEITCNGELFNFNSKWMLRLFKRDLKLPPCEPFDYEQHLHGCYEAMHQATGKQVCCSKVFFHQAPQMQLEHWLLHEDIPVILLERNNMLAAALSAKIAEQTGIYNLAPHKKRPVPERFSINIQQLKAWMHTELWWMNHCKTLLEEAGKPYVLLTYEDLTSSEISRATTHLAGSTMPHFEDKYTKITTEQDYASITNLDEVLRACSDPMYGWQLPHDALQSMA